MILDSNLLVNQKKFDGIEKDITCPICQGILNDPVFCSICQNNFCSNCISKWKEVNSKCPYRCVDPGYTSNRFLKKIFSELLKFKCEKGCKEIIPYNEVENHSLNCEKENFKEKYLESATQIEILKVQMENYKDIQNELEQVRERNDELQNEIDEINDRKYEIENLKERNDELRNEVDELREKNDDLESENNELREKNTELENEIEEIREKNNNLENEIKKYKCDEKSKKFNFLFSH